MEVSATAQVCLERPEAGEVLDANASLLGGAAMTGSGVNKPEGKSKKAQRRDRRNAKLHTDEPSAETATPPAEVNALPFNAEAFPWLKNENITELSVLVDPPEGMCRTAMFDARSAAILKVENSQAGREHEEKGSRTLDNFTKEKLEIITKRVANGDVRLQSLKHVTRTREGYPDSIAYRTELRNNARRIYVAHYSVDAMKDGPIKKQLVRDGIQQLLLYMGSCDKHYQNSLLKLFTGQRDTQLRSRGTGSI